MPIPRQLPLPRLADPRYKGALSAIETAKDLLGLNEDEIGILVDEGQLVAFDIRSPGAKRRELRILTASIVHYKQNATDPSYVSPITPDQAIEIVMASLKHTKPFLNRKEISKVLIGGRQHGMNLVDSKALPEMPGTTHRRGPNGSAIVSRPAFIQFLEARLEGGL